MGRIKNLHPAAKASGASGRAILFLAAAVLAPLLVISETFAGEEVRIEHEVSFRRVAGLPAKIRVSASGAGLTWMRIVGTVDDALLVIPLRQKSPGEFEGEIPTPARELRYSFQFGSSAAEARISPVFRRSQTCIPANAAPKDAKSALIEEAAGLDADAERLTAVEKILAKLGGGEE